MKDVFSNLVNHFATAVANLTKQHGHERVEKITKELLEVLNSTEQYPSAHTAVGKLMENLAEEFRISLDASQVRELCHGVEYFKKFPIQERPTVLENLRLAVKCRVLLLLEEKTTKPEKKKVEKTKKETNPA